MRSKQQKRQADQNPIKNEDQEVEGEEDEPRGSRRNSIPDVDDDFLPPLTVLTHQRSGIRLLSGVLCVICYV